MIPEQIFIGEDEVLQQYVGDTLSWEKPEAEPFRSTVFFDPNYNTYVERTGAIGSLTPASVDGPVGTWVSKQGTHVVRAPSDAARMTLRESGGRRYLDKTAIGQKYVSDEAASTWKWLHDGTVYSQAVSFYVIGNNNTKVFPLWSTHTSSQSTVGANISYDNRNSSSFRHALRIVVANGTSNQAPIQTTETRGTVGDRWQNVVSIHAPTASAEERCRHYCFGRLSRANTVSFSPSTADPNATLTIGSFAASTIDSSSALGRIGEVIFYAGEWTDTERLAVESLLDVGNAGLFEVTTPATDISLQAYAYEAFPTFRRLSTGNLLAMWRMSGTHLDKGSSRSGISTDDGSTWTLYDNSITDATYDMRDPQSFELDNGDILAATARRSDITALFTDPKISKSTDGGQSFSLYATIPTPLGHVMLFPFGKWHRIGSTIVAPFYVRTDGGTDISEVWQSSDDGLTWSKRGTIGSGLNETSIIHLTGTTWLAVARHQTGTPILVSSSISTNDCVTWSTPVSGPAGVSPDLFRVGGTIYCLVGDRTLPGGIGLYIWSDSWLHGTTPKDPIYLAEDFTTGSGSDLGYPSAVVDGQSVSIVFYDEYDTTTPGVKFMRFNAPDFGSAV